MERPVREIVKLQHIDETSIIEDIKKVQVEARKLFDSHKIVTDDELFDVPTIASYGACDGYQYYSSSPSRGAGQIHLSLSIQAGMNQLRGIICVLLRSTPT